MTDELEDLLRERRPEPRAEFVVALEDRLMARARRRRPPAAVRGLAFAGTLTLLVVVLGVSGALPLRLGGDQRARAKPRCTTVLVERAQRHPEFDVTRHGDLRVTYRTVVVRVPARRCR